MTLFSVQFNPSKNREERASEWLPVHTDVSNRTDAGRIAQAFAVLHPDRIWAVVQNFRHPEGQQEEQDFIRGVAIPTFKIVDWIFGRDTTA